MPVSKPLGNNFLQVFFVTFHIIYVCVCVFHFLCVCVHVRAAKNYWAKDIIFLVITGEEIGTQAWIDSYMGDETAGKKEKKRKKL